MKTAKRFLTAALAVLFTLMCALPALAADEEIYTLTIGNAEPGHTYEAYQIFRGSYSEDSGKSYLADVNWGAGIIDENHEKYGEMIEALQRADLYDDGETNVNGVNDATKVAMALSKENTSEAADRFNEIVGNYLTKPSSTITYTGEQSGSVAFPDKLAAGYYLVKDENNSVGDNESYTKYLVKLVDDTTMNVKSQSMSLTKVIVEGNKEVAANNAAMGDVVNYKLTSKTSEMDGYESYTYVIHDVLDRGLTFNQDVKVTIDGTDYTDFTVEYTTDPATGYSATCPAEIAENQKLYIRITVNNLKEKGLTEKDVIVTYSATVNEHAIIGTKPNTNTAWLEYSNSPNASQHNKTTTTETPQEHVYTYVAGVEISKVSPDGNPLPGAQFMIARDGMIKLNVTGYSFNENENGLYYKVNDSYVTVEPKDGADTKYEALGDTNVQLGDKIVGMTGDDKNETQMGILRFDGLKAGTYTITEVLAPSGYKPLEKPLTLTITWKAPSAGETECSWEYSLTSEEDAVKYLGGDKFEITNKHGLTLPFTGGAGANLLAGLGLALMVAAGAAFLYIKRRQNRE